MAQSCRCLTRSYFAHLSLPALVSRTVVVATTSNHLVPSTLQPVVPVDPDLYLPIVSHHQAAYSALHDLLPHEAPGNTIYKCLITEDAVLKHGLHALLFKPRIILVNTPKV